MVNKNPIKAKINHENAYYFVNFGQQLQKTEAYLSLCTARYNDIAAYFEHFTHPERFDVQLSVLVSLLMECIERQTQFNDQELSSMFFGRDNFIDELRWVLSEKLSQVERIDKSEKHVE